MTNPRFESTARRAPLAMLALLVVTAPTFARAQVTTTGNIRVAATDQDGLPVPGAAVTAAAEDAATTRVALTDATGLAELRALNPSARYVVTVELAGFRTSRQAGVLVRGPDRVAGGGSGRRQRDRDGRGDRRAAGGGRDERGRRRGHHPRPDRGGPHRPQLPELPATGARGAARRPGVARQPGVQVRPELPRHRRRRGRLARQLLLHRRHQRHRRGQRHVRRQPQHRDHPGAAGADRGHPGRVRRRPRAAVERRHQVGHQPAPTRAARGTTRGWSSPSASGCGATGRRSPRTPTGTPPATPTPIRTPTSRAT